MARTWHRGWITLALATALLGGTTAAQAWQYGMPAGQPAPQYPGMAAHGPMAMGGQAPAYGPAYAPQYAPQYGYAPNYGPYYGPQSAPPQGPAMQASYQTPADQQAQPMSIAPEAGDQPAFSGTASGGAASFCGGWCEDFRYSRTGPCAEDCPPIGLMFSSGFESWRGVSEGNGTSNFGYVSSVNAGIPLIESWGIGGQFGFSGGVFDWMGRSTNGGDEANRVQEQYIFTYGFFRRACGDRIQGGVVHDFMVNDNFGTVSQEPSISQFRGQISWIVNDCNEFGVWATWRDRTATQNYFAPTVPISYRAITQTNLFWHRKWGTGGTDGWLWWGVPAYGRLNAAEGGSIGEFTLGGALQVPVTQRVAAYANLQYMKPSVSGGLFGSGEEYYSLGCGLTFIPGGATTKTIAGQKSMPLLPVANNGSFLVDRSF